MLPRRVRVEHPLDDLVGRCALPVEAVDVPQDESLAGALRTRGRSAASGRRTAGARASGVMPVARSIDAIGRARARPRRCATAQRQVADASRCGCRARDLRARSARRARDARRPSRRARRTSRARRARASASSSAGVRTGSGRRRTSARRRGDRASRASRSPSPSRSGPRRRRSRTGRRIRPSRAARAGVAACARDVHPRCPGLPRLMTRSCGRGCQSFDAWDVRMCARAAALTRWNVARSIASTRSPGSSAYCARRGAVIDARSRASRTRGASATFSRHDRRVDPCAARAARTPNAWIISREPRAEAFALRGRRRDHERELGGAVRMPRRSPSPASAPSRTAGTARAVVGHSA